MKVPGVPQAAEEELRALITAVREIRARQRLTQEAVGAVGGVGRKYVGQLERGELVPSFVALVAIARGLDVPLSELVRVYEERLGGTAPRRGGLANERPRPLPGG